MEVRNVHLRNTNKDIITLLKKTFNLNRIYNGIYRKKKVTGKDVEKLSHMLKDISYLILISYDGEIPALIIQNIRNGNIIHEVAVSIITMYFLRELNQEENKLMLEKEIELALGALLHDIGKSRLKQDILYKTEKLTEEEFNHIKTHPILGYDILKDLGLVEAENITLLHHYILSGYPMSCYGIPIPDYVELVSVTDVLCATLQKRVYHPGKKSMSEIFHILNDNSDKFSLNLTDILIKALPVFDKGDVIITNAGQTYFVYESNKSKIRVRNIFNLEEHELKKSDLGISFLIKGKEDLEFLGNLVNKSDTFINVIQEEDYLQSNKLYNRLLRNIVVRS